MVKQRCEFFKENKKVKKKENTSKKRPRKKEKTMTFNKK